MMMMIFHHHALQLLFLRSLDFFYNKKFLKNIKFGNCPSACVSKLLCVLCCVVCDIISVRLFQKLVQKKGYVHIYPVYNRRSIFNTKNLNFDYYTHKSQ